MAIDTGEESSQAGKTRRGRAVKRTDSKAEEAESGRPADRPEGAEPHDPQTVSFFSSSNTFDNFVVGPSNQFAHAASYAIAENPGMAYNPLFIHSGVGLGKTHLLHSIGNHILKKYGNRMNTFCISAEHFTNGVVQSIKQVPWISLGVSTG